ncbi:hypothetical protein [Brucella anthropi]|uniref:hypothetical protein n=1 Tax=Brucella anthropi TaxID=529 RepID=UPI001F2216A5|nr:hypothetical protein [Brucella anthropi]
MEDAIEVRILGEPSASFSGLTPEADDGCNPVIDIPKMRPAPSACDAIGGPP